MLGCVHNISLPIVFVRRPNQHGDIYPAMANRTLDSCIPENPAVLL
jgi:hypothetical protein